MKPSKRSRIGREITRHQNQIQANFQQLVDEGYVKPLDQWDIEELSRGQPRSRSGGFTGRRQSYLNEAVQEEIRRRFKVEAIGHLTRYFPRALDVLAGLLDEDDPSIRLKACQLLIEYAVGKPTTRTELSTDNKVGAMLASALVMPDGAIAHPIQIDNVVEAEIIDDERGVSNGK